MRKITHFITQLTYNLSFGRLRARFHALDIVLLCLATAAVVVACGGGGGVSGGGTGGAIPVSSSSIGPINGLGSIIVAGTEFEDPISLTQAEDGAKPTSSDLTLGVQVSVTGVTQTLQASAINPVQSIVIQRRFMGILSASAADGTVRLSINGQRILTDRRSIVVGKAGAQEFAGQKVLVSGYLEPSRNDIIATRIELAPAGTPADRVYVTARVQSVDADAQLTSLGFTTVSYARATGAGNAIQVGDVIRFEGTAVSGSTTGVIASRWSNVGIGAAQGDITLRGVVASRPTAASPNTPLVVDGLTVPISPAALAALTDLRRGSTVEVKGRLDQTSVLNASVRIIGYPIDPLPGEEFVQEPAPIPGALPFDDYVLKGGVVESVDKLSNSYVIRGIRIQMPAGAALPPDVYVGSVISIAGQVRQDPTGFYLESVITQPDRQWRVAQQIAQTDRAQDVLINAAGLARVVWIEPNTTNLQSTVYDPATGLWTAQPAFSLGTVTVTASSFGLSGNNLAASSDGRSFVAYVAGGCVYAKAIGVLATQWSTSQLLDADCSNSPEAPRVAVDALGNATVVWAQRSGPDYVLMASRFETQSQLWSTPVQISAANNIFVTPYVAMNSQGSAVAAWSLNGTSAYANVYSNGSWGTATLVTVAISNIAMDESGNATLIGFNNAGIFAARYSIVAGAWSPSVTVLDSLTGGGANVLAVDSTGDMLVVWRRSNTVGALYSKRFSAANNSWGATKNVASFTRALRPSSLAVSVSGQALLGYYNDGSTAFGANPGVISQAFTVRYSFANDSWGSPVSQQGLPAAIEGGAIFNRPMVAMTAGGVAVMTWQQLAAGGARLSFANLFN